MGYTHYWKMSKPLTITPSQRALINEVLVEHADVIEVFQNDKQVLNFNGAPDDHENFYVEWNKKKEFDFCKTARKDYDVVVCKILWILSADDGFTFSSDGDIQGGEEGWAEANAWWKNNKHRLDINSGMSDNKPSQEEVVKKKADGKATFIRLENTTGGHNKYWELNAINDNEAEATWGAIGKAPGGTKVYTNEQAEKLIKEKLKKGYKVVSMK